MRTELYYFQNTEISKKGLLRGLVVVSILLLFNSMLYNINLFGLLSMILIASAISVQNPSNITEAVVYGFLVGLVVFGTLNSNLVKSEKWSFLKFVRNTSIGIVSAIISSYVLYNFKILNYN